MNGLLTPLESLAEELDALINAQRAIVLNEQFGEVTDKMGKKTKAHCELEERMIEYAKFIKILKLKISRLKHKSKYKKK